MKRYFLILLLLNIVVVSRSQVTWDGGGDGVSWNDANNWAGNITPTAADNVLLDNAVIATSYTVNLPAGAVSVSVLSLTITPAGVNTITLNLPASNTATPGLAVTGSGDALLLNNNALFRNSSGAGSGSTLDISNTFRINNGGHYIHNTARGNATIVSQLSTAAGTELGVFEFDVPAASYSPSLSGRTYGTLTLTAVANGGTATYIGSGASVCTVRGNFNINTGVTFSISMSANFIIQQDYTQSASSVFNLQSSTSNNIVTMAGDLSIAGSMTESGTGLPFLELNGTSNQSITASGSITNSISFRMNNAAGATLNSPLTLPYNLTLTAGRISTNAANLLIMIDNATVSGSSVTSFVDGPMKKRGDDLFIFPIGKGTILAPVAIFGGTGAAVTDEFTAEYIRTNPQNTYGSCPTFCVPGLDHVSYVEYWTLDRNVGSASKQVTLAVHSLSFCRTLVNTYVSRRDLTQWTNEPTTISFGPVACGTGLECGTITTTSVLTDFGVFTLATDQPFSVNPLPIRLSSFDVRKQNSTAALVSWELAQCCSKEASFELQKSTDGQNFNRLTLLPGNETTTDYSVFDNRLDKGTTWYRLKMTDADGKVTYSKVVAIINDTKGLLITAVSPNPVRENAMITLSAASRSKLQLEIYSMSGQIMMKREITVAEGSSLVTLNLASLPKGVYYIVAFDQQTRAVSKFLRQ